MLKQMSSAIWEPNFFTKFVECRNSIYQGQDLFIPESFEQVRLEISETEYLASLWLKDDNPIARVILFWEQNKCYFGYFEIVESQKNNTDILDWIESEAKKKGAKFIKGPLNANFFISYRFKLSGNFRFYGEPYHQSFYPDYFLNNGFNLTKKWHTYVLDYNKAKQNYQEIRKKHINKLKLKKTDIKIKFITPWRFNKYLDHCFKLFHKSYKEMPEFTPISYKKFVKLYADFKVIVNPLLSYLIFLNKNPVAFNINYFDPLPLIVEYQRGPQTFFRKLLLLFKIKFNRKNLLIIYVGKNPELEGKLKGIQSMVAVYIAFFCYLFQVKNIYYGYVASDSPSLRSFDKNIKPVCEYGIVEKSI